MDDDQQRRLDALHRLAQQQLRTQQSATRTPAQEPDSEPELLVESLDRSALPPTSVTSRLSRRSRRGLIWALIATLALFSIFLIGPLSGRSLLPVPNPTATPMAGNELIVTSNATFGTVTLNGKKVAGTIPLLVRLAPGDNTITLSAPPFHERTCHVAYFAQANIAGGQRIEVSSNGCSSGDLDPTTSFNGKSVRNGYVALELTGADLPDDLRSAAENALWAKLAILAGWQVPAGDYYATGVTTSGRITTARADIPLVATPVLARVNSTQNTTPCAHLGCAGQEILPGQHALATPVGTWRIRESAAIGWQFNTNGGAFIASSPTREGLDVEVDLMYSSTSGWSVVDNRSNPLTDSLNAQIANGGCQVGLNALKALVAKSSLAQTQLAFGSGPGASQGPAPTDGCAWKLLDGTNSPLNPSGAKTYGAFIWRWGVLLAADAQAHALFSSLPVAPQNEIAAVGGIDF